MKDLLKSKIDLSTILKLIEKREEITTELKMLKLPSIVIEEEDTKVPIIALKLSKFGDLLIYKNIHAGDIYKLLSKISDIEDFSPSTSDLYNLDRNIDNMETISYMKASRDYNEEIKHKYRRRDFPPTEFEEESPTIKWRTIAVVPIKALVDVFDLLKYVLNDDFNSE